MLQITVNSFSLDQFPGEEGVPRYILGRAMPPHSPEYVILHACFQTHNHRCRSVKIQNLLTGIHTFSNGTTWENLSKIIAISFVIIMSLILSMSHTLVFIV